MTWDFAEAKDRFEEVVDLALTEGPQTIARGDDRVVVISAETFGELVVGRKGYEEFLREGVGLDELDLTRDQTPWRDVEL